MELMMNTQMYIRLSWQIPVLVFMAVWLMPNMSWFSNAIGAWPVWLLSMPCAVFVRHALLSRALKNANHSLKSAQVFVFEKKRASLSGQNATNRRAA
jgi:hypothetical protein